MKELLMISAVFILCVGLVACKKSSSSTAERFAEGQPEQLTQPIQQEEFVAPVACKKSSSSTAERFAKDQPEQLTQPIQQKEFIEIDYEISEKIAKGDPQQIEQFIKEKGAQSATAVALLNYIATDYFGSAEKIKLLLDQGVNVNAKGYGGYTVLHHMAQRLPNRYGEELERVKVLLKRGADVNAKDNFGRTPLHLIAMGFGDERKDQVAKLFIENCADVNARDKEGNTPLHYVFVWPSGHGPSFVRKIDLVKMLLKAGADVNAKNDYGITPLFYPVREWGVDAVEMTKFLISQGADVNAKNKWGQTPIMWTANYFGEPSQSPREVLLAHGAKKEDIRNTEQYMGVDTAAAIKSGDKAKVEEYLKEGVWGYSPARNFDTQPFYDRSTPNNKFSFYPADPSQGRSRIVPAMEDYRDVSALAVAAEYNQVEIAKLLVDYGEDINDGILEYSPGSGDGVIAGDTYYISPLTIAVQEGNKEMVEFLISNGVLLNTEGRGGQTALNYAKNHKIKNLLIKAGARKGSGQMRKRY